MKNRRICLTLFSFLILFFIFKSSCLAVSVNIANYPAIINEDPFTITASVSGATAGTNYLKIDIFKEETTNYFGETFNGSDWYGGSAYSQYLPISIQSGATWSGSVQGRIGSPSGTQYDGQGTYKMRLRRYTSGGGYTSSEANNSAVVISLVLPTSTPTAAPTPIPSNTPTAIPTLTPTKTPIPSPTKSPTPAQKPTLTSVPLRNNEEPKEDAFSTSVLSKNTENEITPESKSSKTTPEVYAKVLGIQTESLSQILITIGAILLLVCGILIFRTYMKSKKEGTEV